MNKAGGGYALGAAILALALWSGTAIANKIAIAYMSGLTVGVLRSMLAGAIAVVIAVLMRMPRPAAGRDTALLVLSGLASFAAWPVFMSVGLERTTTTHAAIIMAMIPVFTVLISHLVQRGVPPTRWWPGAMMALVATIVLVLSRGPAPVPGSSPATVTGDLLILIGCLVCASGYVAGGKVSEKIGGLATTFWGLSAAFVLLVPVFAFLVGDTAWDDVSAGGWLAIGWMTILSSLIGYVLWFYALGKGGIAKMGTLQLAMPVTTIAAAAVILGEEITATIAVITLIIVVSTWWAHRSAG